MADEKCALRFTTRASNREELAPVRLVDVIGEFANQFGLHVG
jgi:hypothetical protein